MKALRGIGLEPLTGYGLTVITGKTAYGTAAHQLVGLMAFGQEQFMWARASQEDITSLEIIGNGFRTMGQGCSGEHMQPIANWGISSRTIELRTRYEKNHWPYLHLYRN